MAEAIKIRVQIKGDLAEIRLMMPHVMETGQRKDDTGKLVPAHFIQSFVVTRNGEALLEGQLNTSIARNPVFTLRARGIKPGDRIGVSWKDNLGDTRSDEIVASS